MSGLTRMTRENWAAREARHLLNRAGFGVPLSRVEALAALSPEEAFASLAGPDSGAAVPAPEFILEPLTRGDLKRMNPEADYPALQLIYQERQREERQAVAQLQSWWLERMQTTSHPLAEKMTLFWHGHFATSAQKVRLSYHNHQLYEIFHKHALGNIKALAIAVGQSPAMLEYLDNRKSTRQQPNENWARELMELFTLGQGQYTEQDIKESARAFTGWTCDRTQFVYQLARHDDGEKAFLGRTGRFDGWDIIDIIFEQPAAARFLAGKLWAFFAGAPGDPAVIEALAQTLRDNNYEVRPMLEQLFTCEAFHQPGVIGNQIKSPVQYALQLCHDLGLEPPYAQLPRATRALGQDLFYPPNVKGWDGNRAWISANTLLIRYNLPAMLVASDEPEGDDGEPMMMGATLPQGARPGAAMLPATGKGAAVSKEDRQAYYREARKQALEKLKALPPEERAAKGTVLREGSAAEKKTLMRELGIAPPPWQPRSPEQLFDTLRFATAGECVDQLATRFMTVPLGESQRAALLDVIGAANGTEPLTPAGLNDRARSALLRLVTSMAEYQLC